MIILWGNIFKTQRIIYLERQLKKKNIRVPSLIRGIDYYHGLVKEHGY